MTLQISCFDFIVGAFIEDVKIPQVARHHNGDEPAVYCWTDPSTIITGQICGGTKLVRPDSRGTPEWTKRFRNRIISCGAYSLTV